MQLILFKLTFVQHPTLNSVITSTICTREHQIETLATNAAIY